MIPCLSLSCVELAACAAANSFGVRSCRLLCGRSLVSPSATPRSSAARRTGSETSSPSNTHLGAARENFPRARSALACPAECALTRSFVPHTRPENADSSVPARCRSGSPAALHAGHDHFQRACLALPGWQNSYLLPKPNAPAYTHPPTQHPDRPSALHRIVYKIQRPLLVGRGPRHQRLSLAHAMLPLFFRRIISPASRYTRCTRLWFTWSPERPNNTCSRDTQSAASFAPTPPAASAAAHRFARPVTVTRYRHPHQPANPALARCVLAPQPVRVRPLVYELHPFFAISAFSISLSRLRSTTSFFNFVFSSRNCFASCASLTSIPPYFTSRRRSYASTLPLLWPRLLPCALLPVV